MRFRTRQWVLQQAGLLGSELLRAGAPVLSPPLSDLVEPE
jgi:hypothetical protein